MKVAILGFTVSKRARAIDRQGNLDRVSRILASPYRSYDEGGEKSGRRLDPWSQLQVENNEQDINVTAS